MKVYLTGVHTIKNPKNHSNDNNSSLNINQKEQDKKLDNEEIKEENLYLESDKSPNSSNNNIVFPQGKSNFSKFINSNKINNVNENEKRSRGVIKKSTKSISNDKYASNNSLINFNNEASNNSIQNFNNMKNSNSNTFINNRNNFISNDDQNNKKKYNFKCHKDFSQIRHQNLESKKKKELIMNELKDEYLEYIMLKEPKYADFDKISEDYRKKIYQSYKIYNKNLLVIAQKKEEHQKILSIMEKSLINNYYVKDSSMLPIYEKLIEKLKVDILTKQQEHDGYKKLYDELYNQNYTIKRKVLDEIDIDRTNEDFYDQYKILKNHAIVQVSKKQDTLNQIEDYYQKVIEEHEKEIKQKITVLKELKLQIEVFKEDEKDLVHKIKKLKAKREQVKKSIKEKENKIKKYENNYVKYIKRYQKSFISMNKIFKSVNAKNLDDVLLDVNSINARFNNLKNKIIKLNQDISDLNSIYSMLNKNLDSIQKQILCNNRTRENLFNEDEQNKIIQIKNLVKKEKEEQNKIREEFQSNIGSFHNGITFIFEKIKLLVLNIKFLKKIISPKIVYLVKKYKHTPFSVDYEHIDRKFFKNFSLLFFQYSNILFYLTLRSISSGISTMDIKKKGHVVIVSILDKTSLNIYQDGVKKILKEYKHRSMLKMQKQKEIDEKTKQRELEDKIDNKFMEENKAITQKQMYKRFIEYLQNKESQNANSTKNEAQPGFHSIKDNSKKNSIFFTGIDSIKLTHSKILESSSSSSVNVEEESTNKINIKKPIDKKIIIPLKEKEEFLDKNKNKLINIFSKYQNTLVKENDKNIYYQKITMKKNRRARSQIALNQKYKYRGNNNNNEIIYRKKKTPEEETLSKKKPKSDLLDEDYEYDEEDNLNEKNKNTLSHRKDELKNYYSYLKLSKDRAEIYKKMNDLRKLQMAYFGGRFLCTKIKNESNNSGENKFDEFINNYYRKQNLDQYLNNNKKNRLSKKKRSSSSMVGRQISSNKNEKENYFSYDKRINYKRNNKLKNADISIKPNNGYSWKNKNSPLTNSRTQRYANQNKFNKIFPNTPNKYRTFSPNNNNKYYYKK